MINIQDYAKQAKQTTSQARQAYENAKQKLIEQINNINSQQLRTKVRSL